MANEITIGAQLSASKGGAAVTVPLTTKQQTMVGTNMEYSTQTVGTAEETLGVTTDIGDIGYLFLKNLDATNFLRYYYETAEPTKGGIVYPGDVALFSPATQATIYVAADTATIALAFAAIEK